MPTFTPKEIFTAICIGVAVFAIGTVMTITGAACLEKGIGTPEYIVSLRNTGWTLIALSALWTALASFHHLNMR